MIDELYFYAFPKILDKQKVQINLSHILCIALYSFMTVFVGKSIFGIVITALYLIVSLLFLLDKDYKSKYLKLTMLACAIIAVASLYIFESFNQQNHVVFWSTIFGSFFFVMYEIVIFIKIKHKCYSSYTNTNIKVNPVRGITIFLAVLIFRFFNRLPALHFLIVTILVLLSAAIILLTMISVQKLIIYLFTRNKVQVNCENVEATDEIEKS